MAKREEQPERTGERVLSVTRVTVKEIYMNRPRASDVDLEARCATVDLLALALALALAAAPFTDGPLDVTLFVVDCDMTVRVMMNTSVDEMSTNVWHDVSVCVSLCYGRMEHQGGGDERAAEGSRTAKGRGRGRPE